MQPQNRNESFFANAAATLRAAQQSANNAIGKVTGPLLRDGMLAAAFRQGASEFYEGLKPFPETLQVNEPGTLLNPTQGEIAKDRDPKRQSPSDIARSEAPSPPDPSHEQAMEMGRGM